MCCSSLKTWDERHHDENGADDCLEQPGALSALYDWDDPQFLDSPLSKSA